MAAPVVRASPLAAFQARARRCLEGRQPQLCEQALVEAEALQQQGEGPQIDHGIADRDGLWHRSAGFARGYR